MATRFAGKHPVDVFFLSGLAAPAACSPVLRSHGGEVRANHSEDKGSQTGVRLTPCNRRQTEKPRARDPRPTLPAAG